MTIGRIPIAVPGIVTSLHDFPWSRDTWMTPLLTPIQMTPGVTIDAAIDPMGRTESAVVSAAAGRIAVSTGGPGWGTGTSGLSIDQAATPSAGGRRSGYPAV